MYDVPALRDANDALVASLRALAHEEGVAAEAAPIAQICGYPLQTTYRGQFTLLGVPCYDVPGCDGPEHRSFIVVARASSARAVQDLRGGRFAVNAMDSNTGMNLPRRLFATFAQGKPFFGSVVVTGSHRSSMEAVAHGRADAAAIDCITFGLLDDYDPAATAGLRILARTSTSPAIPFVTPRTTSDRSVEGMRRALASLSARGEFAPLRAKLRIERIAMLPETAYAVLSDYHAQAVALGYPTLA